MQAFKATWAAQPWLATSSGCAGPRRNLHVDSKTLKNSLAPVTQKALEKQKSLLLQVAREQCLETLSLFQQRVRELGEQPRSLKEFADYCDTLNKVRDESKEMEDRALQVNEMYDLLEAYEVKVPPSDQVKKDDLKEMRENLNSKTGEADGAVEGKMGQMTATLEKSIANLEEDISGVVESLNAGDFVDPACDPKLVLEKLAGVQEQLGAISEKADGYSDAGDVRVPCTSSRSCGTPSRPSS